MNRISSLENNDLRELWGLKISLWPRCPWRMRRADSVWGSWTFSLEWMMCNIWSSPTGPCALTGEGWKPGFFLPLHCFLFALFSPVQGAAGRVCPGCVQSHSQDFQINCKLWVFKGHLDFFFFFLTSIKNGTFAFGKNLDIDKNPREETKTAVVSPYQKNTNTFNPTWMWLRGVFC